MASVRRRITLGYVGVLAASLGAALVAGWSPLGSSVDGSAYDWMLSYLQPPRMGPPVSVILSFDEVSLQQTHGLRNLRPALTEALNQLRRARPRVTAIDVTLSDKGSDAEDAALARAMAATPNLVLASDIVPRTADWEEPIPSFASRAAAIGHVYADPDPVSRMIPLRRTAGFKRRWALSLEAYRLSHNPAQKILELPGELDVGTARIPVTPDDSDRMWIRYLPPLPDGRSSIPDISFAELKAHPDLIEQFRGKAVFIGVTSQGATHDRLLVPNGSMMSGVAIHAHSFETIEQGRFLTAASNLAVVLTCLSLVVAAGFVFAYFTGKTAYAIGLLLIGIAHAIPHLAFSQGIVFPYLAPVVAAWLGVVSAAAWMYFFVRLQLRQSESDRARYQQAIHFVTHEMRSPLNAIQGSAEIMGRYTLNEEKRKQMTEMINSESKRLARMIQTFLDIERLSDGQMEFRREVFEAATLIHSCLDRVRPLAERKEIGLHLGEIEPVLMTGDRELMEYAVYNLLTNAVKYSDTATHVTISSIRDGASMRLSVKDQGIGMDEKELKNIFRKFYRTRTAENSGEVGTGIGLSIVEQIVSHHGGKIEVTSRPGQGSCFTMVLPRGNTNVSVPASTLASK